VFYNRLWFWFWFWFWLWLWLRFRFNDWLLYGGYRCGDEIRRFQPEFGFRDVCDVAGWNFLKTISSGGAQYGFDDIIGHARNTAAKLVQQVRRSSLEYVFEIYTGEAETMHQVAPYLRCAQGFNAMALSHALGEASKLWILEELGHAAVAHQHYRSASGVPGIGGSQCFEFRERFGANPRSILDDDHNARILTFQLTEKLSKRCKLANWTSREILVAQFFEQELEYVSSLELHASYADRLMCSGNRLQGFRDQGGFADTCRTRYRNHRVLREQCLFQVCHRRRSLRSDEYIGTSDFCRKRELL
jgi:hypothetical protein